MDVAALDGAARPVDTGHDHMLEQRWDFHAEDVVTTTYLIKPIC